MRILNELCGLIRTRGGPLTRRSTRWQGPPTIDPRFLDPATPRGTVIFTGLGRRGFAAKGKIDPTDFLPPFIYTLWRYGLRTRFAATPDELGAALGAAGRRPAVVHIYDEERETGTLALADDLCADAGLVFNRVALGAAVARKDETNRRLAAQGVRVPRMIESVEPGETAFSNALGASGAEVSLVRHEGALDPKRYNTEFIDTRRSFRDAEYHTTIRLMCVGGGPVAAWVRARPVEEGSPSVHSRDTPLDPDLIEHLHGTLIAGREADFAALAERIEAALGPAFLAHDLLIDSQTDEIHVCETGLKFHDETYRRHTRPVAAWLPCLAPIHSPTFIDASARAFLTACDAAGCFERKTQA